MTQIAAIKDMILHVYSGQITGQIQDHIMSILYITLVQMALISLLTMLLLKSEIIMAILQMALPGMYRILYSRTAILLHGQVGNLPTTIWVHLILLSALNYQPRLDLHLREISTPHTINGLHQLELGFTRQQQARMEVPIPHLMVTGMLPHVIALAMQVDSILLTISFRKELFRAISRPITTVVFLKGEDHMTRFKILCGSGDRKSVV